MIILLYTQRSKISVSEAHGTFAIGLEYHSMLARPYFFFQERGEYTFDGPNRCANSVLMVREPFVKKGVLLRLYPPTLWKRMSVPGERSRDHCIPLTDLASSSR